ncbi:MAG: thioredoxin family protein [Cyclobacteriaceae bacterium]
MKKYVLMLSALFVTLGSLFAQDGYQVGDYARDFSLNSIEGKQVSLSDFSDAKGFIVVFTCNTCPYAKMYEQRVKDLQKDYAGKGYPVIAINPNCPERSPGDAMAEMQARAQEKDFNFVYLQDESQEIAKAYGATNTPHTYVLKKEAPGKFRVAYIGAIDNNYKDASKADVKYVREAIDALEAGRKVPTTSSKAIGCTIKWKIS